MGGATLFISLLRFQPLTKLLWRQRRLADAAGVDWVVIEMEHGHLQWRDVIDHLRTAAHSDTAALVRIAEVTDAT